MEEIITMMYASAAFINMISFVPQVIKLLRDRSKSDAISLQTQALWLYAVVAGLLYATMIVNDPVLIAATTVTFTGCVSITLLTLFNRFKERLFGIKDKSLFDICAETKVMRGLAELKMKMLMLVWQPVPERVRVSRFRAGLGVVSASLLTLIFFPAHA